MKGHILKAKRGEPIPGQGIMGANKAILNLSLQIEELNLCSSAILLCFLGSE